jgi:predicted metal-dependent HD superfamily phosphohydrolase/GNAT superfamily N-acetyltransferase
MAGLVVRPLLRGDDDWRRATLVEGWGSTVVARRGELVDAAELDGFVAERDGERVGLLTWAQRGPEVEVVTIQSVVEGVGAGRAMLDAVVARAAAAGAGRVWLVTTNDNTGALAFYQRCGFGLVALHRDAVALARQLKPDIPLTGADGICLQHELELETRIERAIPTGPASPLQARWDTELAGAPAEASTVAFTDLVARHGEGHRRYHTIEHVVAVLDALGELGAGRAARLAGWYHDVVYDPTAPDNEARSAELARTVLPGLGVDEATVAETARLIELTREHRPAAGDAQGAMLIDADLSILGAEPARYDAYAAGVRAEYTHVPDELWRPGRAAVLATFLDRPRLFHTGAGRDRWEERARANLRRELAALS